MSSNNYQRLINNTKCEKIRLAIYEYPKTVQWRVRNITNGYISDWDEEWFYHFKLGEYETIEWLEIKIDSEEMKNDIVEY